SIWALLMTWPTKPTRDQSDSTARIRVIRCTPGRPRRITPGPADAAEAAPDCRGRRRIVLLITRPGQRAALPGAAARRWWWTSRSGRGRGRPARYEARRW